MNAIMKREDNLPFESRVDVAVTTKGSLLHYGNGRNLTASLYIAYTILVL